MKFWPEATDQIWLPCYRHSLERYLFRKYCLVPSRSQSRFFCWGGGGGGEGVLVKVEGRGGGGGGGEGAGGGIFQLMFKESGGGGGDGKGITPCSRSALVPIIALSRFSLVSSTPL